MKYITLCLNLILLTSFAFAGVNDNYEDAQTAFKERRFDVALVHLKSSLSEDNQHLPSKILMGKVFALSFMYDDAIDIFSNALIDGADANQIIEYLANALLMQSRYEEIILLSELTLTESNKAILFAIQAKAFNQLGDDDRANTLFTSAIKLSPENPAIADAYAKFLIAHNDLEHAIRLAQLAVDINSSYTEAYRTLAAIYKIQNNIDAHIKTLQAALKVEELQPLVLRDLVKAYIQNNQLGLAEQTVETILVSSPEDPMAKFIRILLLFKSSKIDEAEQALSLLQKQLQKLAQSQILTSPSFSYINGLSLYALGNKELAIEELLTYLSYQPNDIQTSIILSEMYTSEKSYTSAISILEQFIEKAETELGFGARLCRVYIKANLNHRCNALVQKLEPKFSGDPNFISLKAKTLAARGRENEALKVLESIKKETDSLLIDKALLSMQLSRYEEAQKYAERLLIRNVSNHDYKNLLASIYLRQNKRIQAKQILLEILSDEPEHFSARFNLSTVYANFGELELARSFLSELLLERPNHFDVLLMLAKTENRITNYTAATNYIKAALLIAPDAKDALLELASIYSNTEQIDEALAIVNPIIKANFLDASYLSFRADLLIRAKNYESAKFDLATLFGIYSDDPHSLYNLALFQERAQDMEGAWKSIQRSVALNPNIYLTQVEKVRFALAAGEIKTAEIRLKVLNKKYGRLPDLLMLDGDLALSKNQFETAAGLYQRAISAQRTFSQALYKAYVLAGDGFKTKEFIILLESLISEKASSDLERHMLGDLYLSQQQFAKAKSHYLPILQNNHYTRLDLVLNNFANIHLLAGEYNEASEKAMNALQLQPKNASILDTLGWSMAKKGDFDSALPYLQQAYEIETQNPSLRYHLAYTLYRLDENTQAKIQLENLLHQFENFEYKEEAQVLLRKIEMGNLHTG